MSDLKARYPLSTPDGQAIPLDVVRPYGLVFKTFLSSGPTAALTIPAAIEVFSILASEDCLIKFAASAASAAVPADGVMAADTGIASKDILTVLSPPVDKKSISLIGLSANGTATLSYYENWSGLSLQSQITRR